MTGPENPPPRRYDGGVSRSRHAFDPADDAGPARRFLPRELRSPAELWPVGYLEDGTDPDFLDRLVPPSLNARPRLLWGVIRGVGVTLALATVAWFVLFLLKLA